MKQTATVVNKDGKLVAEVIRSEACASCRACSFGQKERVYAALPPGNYKEGDMVELELDAKSFKTASLIAYGIPALAFVIGLLLGNLFSKSELVQAACALVALGLGLFVVRSLEARLKKSGKYTPKCKEIRNENGG